LERAGTGMVKLRGYEEADRAAIQEMGQRVYDEWHRAESLHLVAGSPAAAHLQVVDRTTTPTRRVGRCEMTLFVHPSWRCRGIGSALLDRAWAFVVSRDATHVRASYMEDEADVPAAGFLKKRGFVELQRYCPSRLDLAAFDPAAFETDLQAAAAAGVRLLTYAELEDTPGNRQRVYELEALSRASIPWVLTEPMEPQPYQDWERHFQQQDFTTVFLAELEGRFVGLIDSLVWCYTGVHPEFRRRGIASALKIRALTEAKSRGMEAIETENLASNHGMIAINRKLGFVFGPEEVECARWVEGSGVGITRIESGVPRLPLHA
jgi:mycothiol synthase